MDYAELVRINATSSGDCFGEELEFCCDDVVCCQPHNPALIWCDLCASGGIASGAGTLAGSSPQNACCIGGSWYTTGGTFAVNGGSACVDTVIVFGTNIESIVTPFGPGEGVCVDECGGEYYAPIVVHDPDVQQAADGTCVPTSSFSITVNAGPGGVACVDRIVFGQKMYFPEGTLDQGYTNIFAGSDCKTEVIMSECCTPICTTVKREPINLDLELICAPEWYVKQRWKPFMRYACKNGVCFMPSVNRCQEDVFCGWFESTQAGSSYSDPWRQTLSLSARGFISTPQPK